VTSTLVLQHIACEPPGEYEAALERVLGAGALPRLVDELAAREREPTVTDASGSSDSGITLFAVVWPSSSLFSWVSPSRTADARTVDTPG